MNVSVVILAYNEERDIGRCLESLLLQTVTPIEIIVVDNNSKDKTAAIASSYPNVRVIPEKRQGITYACATGFNATKGDLIARIDADSYASPGWIEAIKKRFENEPDILGLSGPCAPLELSPKARFRCKAVGKFTRWVSEVRVGVKPVMLGHNMALSQKAWQLIKTSMRMDDSVVMEDVEIALLLHSLGKVRFEKGMLIKTRMIEYFFNWPKIYRYAIMAHKTRDFHWRKK